eukprot:TRINITY_DN2086_c1_g1_i1.p1 TRINITY_DN2086_c1_g1~~TRINITY_DN2086_c1_g1_i1.p1  ORF type:complete len:384 (+),score=165.53 TRINITY_DN2086_c1_g1_i1:42-1154(+)
MASAAGYQLAREKWYATSTKAALQEDVERQSALQAELQRSQETKAAMTQTLARQSASDKGSIAMQQLYFTESDYAQNKMKILMHGFDSVASIFTNVNFIAALVMGYSAAFFRQQDTGNVAQELRWFFWGSGLVVILLMMHTIFVSTLAVTDATELAYQGAHGMDDLLRAFHGLMVVKDEVFLNFVAGFGIFLLLVIVELWVKLDEDETGSTVDWLADNAVAYGVVLTALYLLVSVVQMVLTLRRLRRQFGVEQAGLRRPPGSSRLLPSVDLAEDDLVAPSMRRRGKRRRPPQTEPEPQSEPQPQPQSQPEPAPQLQPPEPEPEPEPERADDAGWDLGADARGGDTRGGDTRGGDTRGGDTRGGEEGVVHW